MKVEARCDSKMTDEEMQAARGMGIHYLAMNCRPEDANVEALSKFIERSERYDLEILDAGCPQLQKCSSIILGKPDRDEWIEKYNDFTRVLGKVGVKVNYIAWQPNGVFRKIGKGKYTRGENAFICDMDEINAQPIANDRVYGEEEIWDNFKYFLDKTLPVCEEADVKLSLHPNDPPVPETAGCHNLIWNTESYRRAFQLANDSPYLTMKLCVGCWLEDPKFGDLMNDIMEFTKAGKITVVHFRNISSPMPYFEETLMEDGYADMYEIMKQLVRAGYDGGISIDHAFFNQSGHGMSTMSSVYFLGFMKGLLDAAEKEVKRERTA